MKLKFKLDSLEGLDEETKKLYVKKGDKYVLDLDGIEEGDVAGLKTQIETLLAEKKDISKQLKEIKDAQAASDEAKRKAEEEAARKAGDVDALEKSWQQKHDKAVADLKAAHAEEKASLEADLDRLLRQNVAQQMAREIAVQGSEALLVPHILDRLGVEVVDGKRTTVVLDAAKKRSALTVEELQKEFVGNPAFKPVIAGSKASGGGAGGGQQDGGGAAKKFSEMTEAERVKLFREKPEEYRKLRDAEKGAKK